jgi:hypothetical protein
LSNQIVGLPKRKCIKCAGVGDSRRVQRHSWANAGDGGKPEFGTHPHIIHTTSLVCLLLSGRTSFVVVGNRGFAHDKEVVPGHRYAYLLRWRTHHPNNNRLIPPCSHVRTLAMHLHALPPLA